MSRQNRTARRLRAANLRRCQLVLWQNFRGYGFYLEASEESPYSVQFVEAYSPAAAGGLQPGDVILRVNDQDVSKATYQQVIEMLGQIVDSESSLELLVVEGSAYPLLKSKKVKINAALAVVISTPQKMPADCQFNFKYQPRICEMGLTRSESSFGFQTSYDSNDRVLIVEEINDDTPASGTFLRENDRVFEINNKMIDDRDRKAVFKKLDKARGKRVVRLSVVHAAIHQYCRENNIPLSFEHVQSAVEDYRPLHNKEDHHSDDDDGGDDEPVFIPPKTWKKSTANQKRFLVAEGSKEFQKAARKFRESIGSNCTRILRIERIQNESWYKQFQAHRQEFKKRLKEDTERQLFHGCPSGVTDSIIESYFNRTFAGVNGTVYGAGAYFSSNASYSHRFTAADGNGERCMFLVRVLIGKTTLGNTNMKTPPAGYNSTTDNNHIFVVYYDTQALAEYLITYT